MLSDVELERDGDGEAACVGELLKDVELEGDGDGETTSVCVGDIDAAACGDGLGAMIVVPSTLRPSGKEPVIMAREYAPVKALQDTPVRVAAVVAAAGKVQVARSVRTGKRVVVGAGPCIKRS